MSVIIDFKKKNLNYYGKREYPKSSIAQITFFENSGINQKSLKTVATQPHTHSPK